MPSKTVSPAFRRTYQPGETVIVDGSTTGRLLILKKGTVAVVKEDTEIATVAEPGAVFGELSAGKPAAHSRRACLGNLTVPRSQCDHAARTKPDRGALRRRVLAHRLDGANHALIQLKHQLSTGEPHSVVAKTVSKIEELLAVGGASLVYAGYPYDPH